jgi:ABC-type nitrate/sulfonate/bicarbonate transport system permease component
VKGSRRLQLYVLTVASVLAVWVLLTSLGLVQPLLLPSPSSTGTALWQVLGGGTTTLDPVLATLGETAAAFAIAAVVAVLLGVVTGSVSVLRRAYEPVLTGLSALPLVVLYPVLAATLGIGSASKIALGALYAFFPVVIATMRATGSVDPRLTTAARAMGCGRVQHLYHVVLPSVLSPVLASLRVGLGLALVTVIAGEFISGAQGVGYELGMSSQSLDSPTLFAWVVIACALTVLVSSAFSLCSIVVRKGIYR